MGTPGSHPAARHPDVVIVGGGVIGCSVAYHLAEAGLRVLLLERDELARCASGAAAGMLAPLSEAGGTATDGAFFRAALLGMEQLVALAPRLHELSGVDPQLVAGGLVRAAMEPDEAVHLRAQAASLASYGVRWEEPAALRERVPWLVPSLLGGQWSPRECHVYSPALARAYAGAAATLGVELRMGVEVTGVLRSAGRIRGVQTAAGPVPAGHVVLCTGAWARHSAAWLGVNLPVEPVRGQILALEAPPAAGQAIVWGTGVYLVPKRNGSLVVGATEERVGFDCRVTAGGVAGLLRAAFRLAPGLAGCSFREAWAGLRPGTPDHLPLIGPLPGLEGVTVAAGHYRNGVLLSAVTGVLVEAWVRGGPLPEWAAAFHPERLVRPATVG
jgi:glycine oxidase